MGTGLANQVDKNAFMDEHDYDNKELKGGLE
jgi:hypothetical protein